MKTITYPEAIRRGLLVPLRVEPARSRLGWLALFTLSLSLSVGACFALAV